MSLLRKRSHVIYTLFVNSSYSAVTVPPFGIVEIWSVTQLEITDQHLTHMHWKTTADNYLNVSLYPVFIPGIFFGAGGGFPLPEKNLQSRLQTGAKLYALNLYFSRVNEFQIYRGSFLFNGQLTREIIRHWAIKRVQIYAYNAPKYVLRPGSAWTRWGTLCAPPDLLATMRGPTSKGGAY